MLGPGSDLFDFMADCLFNFMQSHNLLGKRYHLGFTFSFPTVQHGLAKADLATWTKGFVCSGVEGHDVVELLEVSIAKHPELDIKVDALLNEQEKDHGMPPGSLDLMPIVETAAGVELDGELSVDRRHFGIGSGEWENDPIVAFEVRVRYHLVLVARGK